MLGVSDRMVWVKLWLLPPSLMVVRCALECSSTLVISGLEILTGLCAHMVLATQTVLLVLIVQESE